MPAAADALTYEDRKVQGICTRLGCRRRASDVSSMCVRCHRASKRSSRAYKKRLRDERRAKKQCIWCPQSKVAPATEGSTSCLPCRILRNRIRDCEEGGQRGVHPEERLAAIAAATRKDPDGRTRYHGQQRRGQQTHAQLNEQDLRMVRDRVEPFCAGITILGSEDAKSWHRGQREAVKEAVCRVGEQLSGHIDDILDRLGHFQTRHGKRGDE